MDILHFEMLVLQKLIEPFKVDNWALTFYLFGHEEKRTDSVTASFITQTRGYSTVHTKRNTSDNMKKCV